MSLVLGTRSVAPLFRRMGPVFAVAGAAVAALTWPRAYDLCAYLAAARLVADGPGPVCGHACMGIETWGQGRSYLSPPTVAQILAPFANLPDDVLFIGWAVASLVSWSGPCALVTRDTLVAQAPMVVFSFAYIWGSLWIGQVNLFALGGLLLAFGVGANGSPGLGSASRSPPVPCPSRSPSSWWRSEGGGRSLGAVRARWPGVAIDPSAWTSYVDCCAMRRGCRRNP